MPASLLEVFLDHAHRAPERPLLTFEQERFTYGQLAAHVTAFARGLKQRGLQPGERVALFLENSARFAIAYLGVQAAGGVVVLVNTAYRQVELAHILSDAEVCGCVTGAAGAAELVPLRAQLPSLQWLVMVERPAAALPEPLAEVPFDALLAEGAAASTPLALPRPEELAVLGYTSGTTGRSKGAMLLHRNLRANVQAVTEAWRWTAQDRLLLTLPLFHTHGLMVGLHGTLFAGASVDLRRRFNAAEALAALRDDPSLTMFFGVPTLYSRLLEEARASGVKPRALRLWVSGSAPLSPQLFADVEAALGARILERYGMTETIMNTTNPFEGERRPGTVGFPYPGQEARVVDVRTRQPLPRGETGEIEVRGPHVFAGYWRRQDATAESFDADGWFRTGDLGDLDADGYLRITGRARELIISGGFNVYPREVEEVLAMHPGVAEVAVLGLPDADLGEQVVAVVVPRAGGIPPEARALVDWCKDRLASFKKPRQVVFTEALPRNALGKVQKHLLRASLATPGPSEPR
ncbi:AMP-binding protein [Corallococcus macrosporus]|uniref:Long-chain-fatty-acid--CoA ligase n=1 Tax=Corallococcus macrosporus DSM 14697 TaxID=1189310 RepID=A0A286NVJ3_9BACT|nr:AMP-binding protein [Corallococcus macrosporus]ATB51188.1 long-chain-fatty-acid--CoA ligase [Corallococcus macrosporus DSM 14697]